MRKALRNIGVTMAVLTVLESSTLVSPVQTVLADTVSTSNEQNVNSWMPDKYLQGTIYKALHDWSQSINTHGGFNITSVDQMTPDMMKDVKYLRVDSKKITDLSGMQYATGLVQADFTGNNISRLPDKMPGKNTLYSLNLGNYALNTDSPSWILGDKVSFNNTNSTYNNQNFGFTGHYVGGNYSFTDKNVSFSNGKAVISSDDFFKGFQQADGTFNKVKPTISIKYSSHASLSPVFDEQSGQLELNLSKLSAGTPVQLQFTVNASAPGSSYATWDTLNLKVPEKSNVVTDPMQPTNASEVANINRLSKGNKNVVKSKVKALNDYMVHTMMTPTGTYSGYMTQAEKKNPDTDSHMFEQLTESDGLYLETLAVRGDAAKFDKYYSRVKKTFSNGDGAFYWMYNTKTKEHKQGNASLDDLRIIKALTMMQAKKPTVKRAKEIKELIAGFKKYSMMDGKMINGSYFPNKSKEPAIRLSYLDMQQLQYMYGQAGWSQKDYDDQLQTIEDGYLGDAFPWYQSYYYYGDMNGYKAGEYSTLPEAKGQVNSIDSLLVILHLAQIGKAQPASISWIKAHVHDRTLYNNYYVDGTPVERNSAASSYAIAAMIASTVSDKEMYNDCIRDLNDSQVPAGFGDFSGSLGDIPSMKSATYNNLTGLLAYYY